MKYISIIAVVVALVGFGWFLTKSNRAGESVDNTAAVGDALSELNADTMETQTGDSGTVNPIVILVTTRGEITLELFTDTMPITAGNFLKLARNDFYDGVKFHRVIENFMIQSGDPNSKGDDTAAYGTGGPGYTIEDEHISGEGLTNIRGTIAMANAGPQTGGSQFFINLADNTGLDFDKEPLTSKHPVFGKVVSGMSVVHAIGSTPTDARDVPIEAVIINDIRILDTFDSKG